MKLTKLRKITLFLVIATVFMLRLPNNSNLPTYIVIPLLVSLLAKYIHGDLDTGFVWSKSDAFYWIYVIGVPLIVVIFYERVIIKQCRM